MIMLALLMPLQEYNTLALASIFEHFSVETLAGKRLLISKRHPATIAIHLQYNDYDRQLILPGAFLQYVLKHVFYSTWLGANRQGTVGKPVSI